MCLKNDLSAPSTWIVLAGRVASLLIPPALESRSSARSSPARSEKLGRSFRTRACMKSERLDLELHRFNPSCASFLTSAGASSSPSKSVSLLKKVQGSLPSMVPV